MFIASVVGITLHMLRYSYEYLLDSFITTDDKGMGSKTSFTRT